MMMGDAKEYYQMMVYGCLAFWRLPCGNWRLTLPLMMHGLQIVIYDPWFHFLLMTH
jgi:hypothetical protein